MTDATITGVAGVGVCFAVGLALWRERWYVVAPLLGVLFLAAFTLLGAWIGLPLAVAAAAFLGLGLLGTVRVWAGTTRTAPPVAGRDWDPLMAADLGHARPSAFRDLMAGLYLVETADDVYLVDKTGLSWPDLYRHLYWLEAWGYLTASTWYRHQRLRASRVRLTPLGRREFGAWLERLDAGV